MCAHDKQFDNTGEYKVKSKVPHHSTPQMSIINNSLYLSRNCVCMCKPRKSSNNASRFILYPEFYNFHSLTAYIEHLILLRIDFHLSP